jgi:hypothetical protein
MRILSKIRGADIFKEIIQHKILIEKNRENRILKKLKANVERIRQHQFRQSSQEPKEHYEGNGQVDFIRIRIPFHNCLL